MNERLALLLLDWRVGGGMWLRHGGGLCANCGALYR
jgi:hypothetical protein